MSIADPLSLAQATVGSTYRIGEIDSLSSWHEKLLTLGLLPGVEVRVVQLAPLGDPITIEFNNQRVSIRLTEAAAVRLTNQ